ncbi:MAG: ATP-binding protein [Pseudomonadota bacterium]
MRNHRFTGEAVAPKPALGKDDVIGERQVLSQRDNGPEGGSTVGQPSSAPTLNAIILVFAGLMVAGTFGYVIAERVVTQRVEGVPPLVSVIFASLCAAGLILTVFVADRLWDLYRTQRQQLSGARLYRRLALILSAVALLPAGIAFTLTGIIVGRVGNEFFVERVEQSSSLARNLANAYTEGVSREMGLTLLSAERDLARVKALGTDPEVSPIGYRRYLTGLAFIYNFSELMHIGPDGRIIVRATVGGVEPLPLPPTRDFVPPGEGSGPTVRFGAIHAVNFDSYYAVIPMGGGADGYLVGYKSESTQIANQLLAVRDFRDQNRVLQIRIERLGGIANMGFILLSVVLLLAAAWIGLLVANAIVGPVRRLATAARDVSLGDLNVRVDVHPQDGELGDLGHAFNDMTAQLAEQRDDLIAANEESENRRRFIETMLDAIPAGVISVSREGTIGLSNPSAQAILATDGTILLGTDVTEILPNIAPLFDMAKATGRRMRETMEWGQNERIRTLIIEINPDTERSIDAEGFVITIEDISELVTAQRTAAWADVARRIAHEIKNPLTPIQLSAERLKRRYADSLTDRDREIFDQCTSTIIKHVGDIGRMVTEFSSFARMPEPIMAEFDLRELAREAMFPFTVAHPDITFISTMPTDDIIVHCDGRLIAQALTNLIKNAAEAIAEAPTSLSGRVEIEVMAEALGSRVEIRDNGKGLPAALKHRLTEPYMTTREKGTGLGLAIVRKAIEDHDGSFDIRDRRDGGAVASLFLPNLQSSAVLGETSLRPVAE